MPKRGLLYAVRSISAGRPGGTNRGDLNKKADSVRDGRPFMKRGFSSFPPRCMNCPLSMQQPDCDSIRRLKVNDSLFLDNSLTRKHLLEFVLAICFRIGRSASAAFHDVNLGVDQAPQDLQDLLAC